MTPTLIAMTRCGLTGFAALALGAMPAIANAGNLLTLDQIQVIGSRTGSDSALDSAVPVDIFSGEQLRSAGAVGNELGEALALLAPSFSFPRQSNSVTSDHVRSAHLRGMSPDQVLVLVNGKRRHASAVVNDNTKIGRGTNAFDFNTIPLSAVKRVEILRDGASAQYGSDAIAGVINIVLEDHAGGVRAGVSYGLHNTDVAPIDRTVTDGQSASVWIDHGVTLAEGGFFNYGLEATGRSATNRAGFDRVSPFIPQTGTNLAFAGEITHRVGDPDSDGVNLWLNAERPLGAALIYGNATASYRETEGAAVYRYPDSNQNVPAIFPGGFRPITLGDNIDFGSAFGARHSFGEWLLDHSLTIGHNRFEFGVRNSLNPSLGPDSPTQFHSGTFRFTTGGLGSEARRRFDDALGGRGIDLAAGIDYRFERFESDPGDPGSFSAGDFTFPPELAALVGFPDIGAQGAKGLTPDDAAKEQRHVLGAFVEASSQLSARFSGSAAARFEHYDDFGSTITGKLAGRFQSTETLALRASLSTSFRAPTLAQMAWSRRDNTFSTDGARISSRLVRAGSALGRALGLPDLEEETAVNYSAGVVWNGSGGLRLSIDAFEIRVDDRITLSEFVQDPAVIDFVQAQPGGAGVQAIAAFTNAIDTRTRGVETTASYSLPTGHGLWRFDSAWSWTESRIRDIAMVPGRIAELSPDVELIGVEQINTVESASPEHEWVSSARWQGRRWRASARLRVYSSVVREFAFARQRFSGQYALDLEAGFAISNRWDLTVGSSNITDEYPDASGTANDFFGNFAYDPINPVGVNGRFVYLRSDWRF